MEFKFGTVSTPCGKSGEWEIDEFTINPEAARTHNIFTFREPLQRIRPGTYKRLSRGNTVVMSNTPMEIRTNLEAYAAGKGRVLVNGLGLGMLVEGWLSKPEIQHITVVEKSKDVINLVRPTFAGNERVTIVEDDAFFYKPFGRYDYVYHDIWDEMSADNLKAMATLNRKYGRFADAQGTWSREWVRADQRRENRSSRWY